MEWQQCDADRKKDRTSALKTLVEGWEAEVRKEMEALNQVASPGPRKRRLSKGDDESSEAGPNLEDSDEEPPAKPVRRKRGHASRESLAPTRGRDMAKRKPRMAAVASGTEDEDEDARSDADLFNDRFTRPKLEKASSASDLRTRKAGWWFLN